MATATLMLALAASLAPVAVAQSCIPLSGSKTCPAFNRSSVSTNAGLVSSFPFLAFVSNTQQFDDQLTRYLSSNYVQLKYQQLLGCADLDLTNTSDLYARYTGSVVCNAIVQNSREPCSLRQEDSQPLCADSCAQQAISEQRIVADPQTCSNPSAKAMDQIRADFTVCSLPSNSLSGDCINAAQNEKESCGFANNTIGLCSYCAQSSPNATDSCCYNSNTTRCEGLKLPTLTSLPPLFPTATVTNTPSDSAAAASSEPNSRPLSTGSIAGIVVGAVAGAALLIALVVLLCLLRRRKRGSQTGSVFNQPTPSRKTGNGMTFSPLGGDGSSQPGYEVLPGGRIARMSALEGPSAGSLPDDGAAAGRASGNRRRGANDSSSDEFGDSPDSRTAMGRDPLYPPPTGRRTGSLSSSSMLARAENPNSPTSGSGGEFSSPPGFSSQQSEQLPFFKDYYSQEEIHPNSKVATLWAYQPRAGDEFELERGDMLKVIGIWDDGWATGIRLSEKAEDWDAKRPLQRDSGVSNGSGRRVSSPPPPGEIKAFPLVCVCLPDHWRKTVEGDTMAENNPTGGPSPHGT